MSSVSLSTFHYWPRRSERLAKINGPQEQKSPTGLISGPTFQEPAVKAPAAISPIRIEKVKTQAAISVPDFLRTSQETTATWQVDADFWTKTADLSDPWLEESLFPPLSETLSEEPSAEDKMDCSFTPIVFEKLLSEEESLRLFNDEMDLSF